MTGTKKCNFGEKWYSPPSRELIRYEAKPSRGCNDERTYCTAVIMRGPIVCQL